MSEIKLLSQETIDKIAAGEVVERPSSVVKELVENSIDAKASAITVEIKEGGISFIRITDNGCGIENAQVPAAFWRHSTSKIECAEDLLSIHSLGFRGEALSSIAAVSQVELITKTHTQLTGTRYVIEGSKELEKEEIGAPEGTTFLVRNLFYNVPARRKFLKTAQTESSYIHELMEHMALSHPHISFKFIQNGQTKLHTSGNGNERDLIYHIYGRDITAGILKIEQETEFFKVHGFIGKPMISRGNRNYETYFINGRYIKSALIAKAVEDAYKGFLMQRQYPFCVLYFEINSELLDVNVHPTKMELRFSQNEAIYRALYETVKTVLSQKETIPENETAEINSKKVSDLQYNTKQKELNNIPEKKRSADVFFSKMKTENPLTVQEENLFVKPLAQQQETEKTICETEEKNCFKQEKIQFQADYEQPSFEQNNAAFLSPQARKKHRIIGQLFATYWLIEYEQKLFIVDQHAAHEKVLYERTMKRLKEKQFSSQTISPPIILTLNSTEQQTFEKYKESFEQFGYEIEPFGGKEYAITAVLADFSEINMKDMFLELLAEFVNFSGKETPNLILEKIASMSCKAAVKGNHNLSFAEAEALMDELLELENPYHCPHGRPTIIAMSRQEIEKKFKRIV